MTRDEGAAPEARKRQHVREMPAACLEDVAAPVPREPTVVYVHRDGRVRVISPKAALQAHVTADPADRPEAPPSDD